jgi:hypothetical protein
MMTTLLVVLQDSLYLCYDCFNVALDGIGDLEDSHVGLKHAHILRKWAIHKRIDILLDPFLVMAENISIDRITKSLTCLLLLVQHSWSFL